MAVKRRASGERVDIRRKHRVAVRCSRADVLHDGCAANRAIGRPELIARVVTFGTEEELAIINDEVVLRAGTAPHAYNTIM